MHKCALSFSRCVIWMPAQTGGGWTLIMTSEKSLQTVLPSPRVLGTSNDPSDRSGNSLCSHLTWNLHENTILIIIQSDHCYLLYIFCTRLHQKSTINKCLQRRSPMFKCNSIVKCASIWRHNVWASPAACVCSLYFGMSHVWTDHMCAPAATLARAQGCCDCRAVARRIRRSKHG